MVNAFPRCPDGCPSFVVCCPSFVNYQSPAAFVLNLFHCCNASQKRQLMVSLEAESEGGENGRGRRRRGVFIPSCQ